MKLMTPFLIAALSFLSLAASEEKAIDQPVADAIQKHFLENGYLEIDDDFENVGKVFKGAKIYQIWIKSTVRKGAASGLNMSVLMQGDQMTLFDSGRDAAIFLIKGYAGKVTSSKQLRVLMSAMTPVSEIEDRGEGVYHVYNGDDFFDVPSGYLVKVRGGKVQSCEYKMKLGKKKE